MIGFLSPSTKHSPAVTPKQTENREKPAGILLGKAIFSSYRVQIFNLKCHFCSMTKLIHFGAEWGNAEAGLEFFPGFFSLRIWAAFPLSKPHSQPKFPFSPPKPLLFLCLSDQKQQNPRRADKTSFSFRLISNRNWFYPLKWLFFLPFVQGSGCWEEWPGVIC